MTSEISLGMQIRRQPLKIYRTTIHSAQYGLKWDIDGNLLQPILSFLVLIRSIPRRILTALDLYNKNEDGSIIFKMIRMELVEHEKRGTSKHTLSFHATTTECGVSLHSAKNRFTITHSSMGEHRTQWPYLVRHNKINHLQNGYINFNTSGQKNAGFTRDH